MSTKQVRWGLENLKLDRVRLEELGFNSMGPTVQTSCENHEGSGLVRFQQWDGKAWQTASEWMRGDAEMVRAMIEESAAAYAEEKGITAACMEN